MTSYRGERSELPDCGTTRPSEWSGLPESCSTRSQLKSQSHPLSAWIEERTRDFADFENSFSAGRHSSNTPDIYSLGAAIQHPSFRAPISSRGQQLQVSIEQLTVTLITDLTDNSWQSKQFNFSVTFRYQLRFYIVKSEFDHWLQMKA